MRCDIMRTTRYAKDRKQYYTILHYTVQCCTSAILIALKPWKGLVEFLMAMLRGALLDTTCQCEAGQGRVGQRIARVGQGRG